MIELPAALAAWAGELARLPVEPAMAIAPWVGRLALAIGPWRVSDRAGDGEPDGVGGLGRRGPYERLLASEWAIAELSPDEFVRRAAAHEHLFLELARRRPRSARRSVAIVSAGPAQLGAPRLAHLAVLVVLARRAAAAGAAMAWGVLEDREDGLHEALDAAGLRRLLAARTTRSARDSDVQAWRELGGADRAAAADERWWIGAAEDVDEPRRAGEPCVLVEEVLDPAVRALDVTVHRRGATARVRLELPPPEVCARVLRDPAPPREPASPTAHGAWPSRSRVGKLVAPARAIRFAAGGRRLAVELDGGRLESWPLPGSPNEPLGRPRVWTLPAHLRLLAFGAGRRTPLAITMTHARPPAFAIVDASRAAPVSLTLPAEVGERLASGPPDDRPGFAALVRLGHVPELVMTFAGQLLIASLPPEQSPLVTPAPHGGYHVRHPPPATTVARTLLTDPRTTLAAAAARKDRVEWVEQRADGRVRVRRMGDGGAELIDELGLGRRLVFPRLGYPGEARWGPVALAPLADGTCTLLVDGATVADREVDAPVVAVGSWFARHPALVVQPAASTLAWRDAPPKAAAFPPAADPIVEVEACGDAPLIAWRTDAGEVWVWSVRDGQVLMRLVPARRNALGIA